MVVRLFVVLLSVAWLSAPVPLRAAEAEETPPFQQAFQLWQKGYMLHLFGRYRPK